MKTTCFVPLCPALESALSTYDLETARHSTRVAKLAVALGRSLDLPEEELWPAWWSGMLHDVGKLGVSRDVLRKEGSLTETEWAEIKGHPVIGAELVLAMSIDLAPIAEAIRSHHENWDGTGYPDQRAGPRIPFLGRVIAVADVFDNLTRTRPDRGDRLSPGRAIREIQRAAGRHFDPDLVAAFVDVYHCGMLPLD